MVGFLTKAFTAAHGVGSAIFQKTHELIDLANITAIRLMMDGNFMHIDPNTAQGKWQRRAMFAYEMGRKGMLQNLHDKVDDAFMNPHGAPKPSLSEILREAAGAAVPYLSRPNVLVPIIVGTSALVLGVMLYTANTGHLPPAITDLLAPFLGSGTGHSVTQGVGNTVREATTQTAQHVPPEP